MITVGISLAVNHSRFAAAIATAMATTVTTAINCSLRRLLQSEAPEAYEGNPAFTQGWAWLKLQYSRDI